MGRICGFAGSIMALMCGVYLGTVMMLDHWHAKTVWPGGVHVGFQAGLFKMSYWRLHRDEKTVSLRQFVDSQCGGAAALVMAGDNCEKLQNGEKVSVMMFVVCIIVVLGLFLASLCQFLYWKTQPKRAYRKWAMGCYVLVNGLMIIGLCAYTFCTADMFDLQVIGGGSAIVRGVAGTGDGTITTFSTCYYSAVAIAGMLMILPVMHGTHALEGEMTTGRIAQADERKALLVKCGAVPASNAYPQGKGMSDQQFMGQVTSPYPYAV